MKPSSLLCIFSYFIMVHSISEKVKLFAVTNFDGLEDFYSRLKTKNTGVAAPLQEDAYVRKHICKRVFRNIYFDYRQEEPILDHTEDRFELKEYYLNIFQTIYQKSDRQFATCFSIYKRDPYDYINPYRLRDIAHPNVGKEYVFVCPVRIKKSNVIREYFVSTKYNVNTANYEGAAYIAGRFIFSRDDNSDSLILQALAEESAQTLLTFNIDLFYFLRKGHKRTAETAANDPVCKLSKAEKLRLCSVVLNSSTYEKRVKFLPTVESVEVECEKREITFFIDVPKQDVNTTTIHEEWMMYCKSITIKDGKWTNFYVSRGYGPNRVFVYQLLKEKTLLYRHSTNVAMVDELDLS